MQDHHHHPHSRKRIFGALILNLSFTILEILGGFYTHSTTILANTIHDLGDCFSLSLALLFSIIATRKPSHNFTYGYDRFSLLAALFNACILILGTCLILWNSLPNLLAPPIIKTKGMFWLALGGIVFNSLAVKYLKHEHQNLNEKILNWHLIEDVLTWVVVLIVSIAIYFSNLYILDPLLTIFVSLFILWNILRNLYTTIKIFLQGAPTSKLHTEVQEQLATLPYVKEAHGLHLWSLDGVRHVLTAHLVLNVELNKEIQSLVKKEISKRLARFHFSHTAIEFEQNFEACRDRF